MVMRMNFTLSMTGRACLAFFLLAGLAAGCSAPTPPPLQPTTDPATYVAAAVETLSAKMTEEALLHPSDTPVPPSATPIPPTNTPEPPTLTPTPAVSPTPSATEAPPLSAQFLYAATYPENKRDYVPNEKYGLALGFLNNGTITWEAGYRLKIANYKGEITVQPEVELGQAIAPGQKVEFNLWAFGSEMLGEHTWYFQLYTSQGVPVPGGVGVFTYTSY
jgi:hypothetical protein